MVEITAPSEYIAFDIICTLTPFIERLSREFKDIACEFCFKRSSNLITCNACLDAKYCGKECQEKDWINHRIECHILDKLPLDNNGFVKVDVTRVVGNTILMIKGKDWKSIKIKMLGNEFSFDDLDASDDFLLPYQHIFYNSTKENIRKYIGDENVPNEEDFKHILGKIGNSLYPTTLQEFNVKTTRVLFELPFFSSECIPNCHLVRRNDVNVIVAVKDIGKSEKLSLCRLSLFGPLNIPRITSQCNCTDCRLPYGESVLSKITNEQEALQVISQIQQFIQMWNLFRYELKMPDAEYLLDHLLEEQEGVLGDTNALRLKLLAIKCFETGDPAEMRNYLMKLKNGIEDAFGEHHPYLIRVYSALSKAYFSMGSITLGMLYFEKVKCLLAIYA